MKNGKILGGIIVLVVLLFVYAGFAKLLDLETFRENMYNQHLPRWLSELIIWSTPPAELGVVCCLLFPGSQRAGLYYALILLSIYTIYVSAILLQFFRRTPCSCGGVFRHLTWQQHLWFNLTFIVLIILALILDAKRPTRTNHVFFHH